MVAMVWGVSGCGSDDASADATGPSGAGAAGASGSTASSNGGTGAAGSTSSGNGGAGAGGAGPSSCAPLPPATGATVAVDPSQASSLPAIVADAAAGTTIVLAAGTYLLPASLQFLQDGVTLRSADDDAASVVLDAAYAVNEAIVIAASNVTIAHVTVTHAVDHLVHVYPPAAGVDVIGTVLYGMVLVDGGEQFVKVNPIVGQTGYIDEGRVECSSFLLTDQGRPNVESCCGGCYTGGVDAHAAWKWTVRSNRFEGIWCSTGLAEHAVHFWKGSRDTLVENNVIVDCARGIGFGLGDGAGERVYSDAPYGGAMLAHYDGIIRNNVVWADVPAFDTGIELDETRTPHALHNTVVRGPGATGFFSSIDYRFATTDVVLSNNLTDKITQRDGAAGTMITNLEGATLDLFAGAATLDFHLAATAAAAIDQGSVDAASGADIDGEPHDLGSAPDIGADETAP